MKTKLLIFLCLLIPLSAFSQTPSSSKLRTLYNSLDPFSVSEHLAFYQLYGEYSEGQQALMEACRLLSANNSEAPTLNNLPNLVSAIDAIISLINKQPQDNCQILKENELKFIEGLAKKLPNRILKGHAALTEEEVLALPHHEIDLSRGILLTQLGSHPEAIAQIRSYEAMIDLMALQILARITLDASPQEKIQAISHFIFHEMGFRFPPHSMFEKDVDVYTFLPTVLDSRKGVCLGVSILYLCLAQRLNLNLEMITPPGHIYVRYREGDHEINIETTARGIHLNSEEYLGIDTCALQQRTIKEIIGLAHFNQASVYWEQKRYDKALASYSKAEKYLPDDPLLIELIAYNNLLSGNIQEGEKLLKKAAASHDQPYTLVRESLAEDYLNGLTHVDGIEALFMRVDEKRESLVKKRIALEEAVKKYPKFRSGLFSLAGTWLQLHREREALEVLQRYHDLDSTNPSAEYYLSVLYAKRGDYNKAWVHLKQTETLLNAHAHYPKALTDFRKELTAVYPE